jgi:hypothetical protein
MQLAGHRPFTYAPHLAFLQLPHPQLLPATNSTQHAPASTVHCWLQQQQCNGICATPIAPTSASAPAGMPAVCLLQAKQGPAAGWNLNPALLSSTMAPTAGQPLPCQHSALLIVAAAAQRQLCYLLQVCQICPCPTANSCPSCRTRSV